MTLEGVPPSAAGKAPARPSSPSLAHRAGKAALGGALEALYARVPLGMRLGLDAMRAACMRAGSPESAFTVAHIAGTNGKGSTSAMVEAMARAAGKKTGLYTSPHLCRFAERIRLDGEPIDDDALTDVLERALAFGPDLSFFETATLAAFLAFRDHGVDLAIVEVGIGGRLDATNVVPAPKVSAITRVALDHMDRLGDTLEDIAREKAGIAKAGSMIVLGPMAPTVRAAALEIALANGALPIVMGDDPDAPATALVPGAPYQQENARIAWRVARELKIPHAARVEGLAGASWPGRFEHIDHESGPFVLDGAHNPDGARALVHALQPSHEANGAATHAPVAPGAIVFGSLADKAWREMLDVLGELSAPRIYVAPRGRAAADPAELARYALGGVAPSVSHALVAARDLAGTAPVVVCGSLYLVGQARAELLGLTEDPPVAL